MIPSNDQPQREYQLRIEELKRGESLLLDPDDIVAGAEWDGIGKWCSLTVLRRIA